MIVACNTYQFIIKPISNCRSQEIAELLRVNPLNYLVNYISKWLWEIYKANYSSRSFDYRMLPPSSA